MGGCARVCERERLDVINFEQPLIYLLYNQTNMLTKKQAEEIYMIKLSQHTRHSNELSPDYCQRSLRGKCSFVAKTYGVSPRSVRDIWNRYTWEEATCHLWRHEQAGAIKICETSSKKVIYELD